MRKANWPKTLNEAANIVMKKIGNKGREEIKKMRFKNLIRLHPTYSLGGRIRNEFGLWAGNDSLLRSCHAVHPDNASMKIIRALWRKLQGV